MDHADKYSLFEGDTIANISYPINFKSIPVATVAPLSANTLHPDLQNTPAMDHKRYVAETKIKIILDQLVDDLCQVADDSYEIRPSRNEFIRNGRWASVEKAKAAFLKMMGYENG